MKYIKTLKIDIDKKNFEVIPSVQYDSNTRFLHIHLLNSSVPFDITGCSVKISGTKPDGTAIFNNCSIISAKEGFIEVELTEQMNAVPGTLKCELKLYSGSGVLTTKQFEIEVTASVTSKSIVSSNEFKALTDTLKEVQRFEGRIDELQEHITGGNMQQEHSHMNKTTLDKITESSDGKLMFNGKELDTDIKDDSITTEKYQDGSITGEKLKDGTVYLNKLSPQIFNGDPVIGDTIKNYAYKITQNSGGSTSVDGTNKSYFSFQVRVPMDNIPETFKLEASIDLKTESNSFSHVKLFLCQANPSDTVGNQIGLTTAIIPVNINNEAFTTVSTSASSTVNKNSSKSQLQLICWAYSDFSLVGKALSYFVKNINIKVNDSKINVSFENVSMYASNAGKVEEDSSNTEEIPVIEGMPIVASKQYVLQEISKLDFDVLKKWIEEKFNSIDSKSRLNGKRIGVIGDSYVAGHTLGFEKTWGNKIATRNDMTIFNYGVNGGMLSGSGGVAGRYSNMDSNLDYIIVFAGHNDSSASKDIGTDDSNDINTFKGALNILCAGLQTRYPKARILFMTPTHRTGKEPPYCQAIIDICYKYGIQVYDTYAKLGINIGGGTEGNAKQKEIFELDNTLHLNELGNEYLSYKIESELLTL